MAANLCGNSSENVQDLFLLDVTPLSLGINVKGEKLDVVIPRNTPIPTSKSKTYVTSEDNQSSIRIAVFQGERSRSTDNHLLGEFSICGIPPAPKGVGSTLVCFEIDANGILNVTASIISTGKMEKLIITNKHRRLSCEVIERMVKDAKKYKHEDQEYKEKADEYIALEDCLYKMMKKIKERSIGNNHVLEEIKRVMADMTTWLEDNRVAPFAELELKKVHLEFVLEVYAAFTHLRFMDDVELVLFPIRATLDTAIAESYLNDHQLSSVVS
ncbi:putative heat shock protein 70 family protein [Tanacetum coccineum]